MESAKHYYAFISHSTTDEKIALWLRKELENYHIPSAIQRDYHAPKRLKPIFLYQTDLAGIRLKEALKSSLADSQYLIVICSPEAAKSSYVNDEVAHFIETGRANKIIPFIVSGTPYASQNGNPQNECFPSALVNLKGQNDELRGVSLAEMTEKNGSKISAVVNVIASMLGVRFDVLWNRYKKRRIRRYILASGIFLLLCMAGFLYWEYTRPIYRYFTDYVDCNGVPQGIMELNLHQQRNRHRMYQFEYHRTPLGEPHALDWRVTVVRHINNRKVVFPILHTEMYDRFPVQKIEYNAQTGHVARITYENEYGRIIVRYVFYDKGNQRAVIVDFENPHEQQGNSFLSANSNNLQMQTMMTLGLNAPPAMSKIKRYVYERNEQGYIESISYRRNNDEDFANSAACDADGIYGIRKTLDSLGRCVKLTYLDKMNHPVSNHTGIVSKEYKYDQYGNITETKNLDQYGNLTYNEQLWARAEDIYNQDGNCYLQKYYNTSDQLSPNVYGRMQDVFIYDSDCNIIESRSMDAEGNLCYDNMGVAIIQMISNKDGLLVKQISLNPDRQVCCDNITGTAACAIEFDKKKRPSSVTYYGIDGQKACCRKGYAQMSITYEGNNVASQTFYDVNGELCINRESGFARQTCEYDQLDYIVKVCNYDTNNQLLANGRGAIECRKNLPNGNISEIYMLDENGERFNTVNGFNKMTMSYNNNGLMSEIRYFDKDDQLCMCSEGFAISRATYQETENNGMLYSVALYDTLDRPCMHPTQHVSKYEVQLDSHSYSIVQSSYDTLGQPCLNFQLAARCENQYDRFGHLVQSKYYQYRNGEYVLARNIENVAIQKNKFNERGYWVEASCYDENNVPVFSYTGNSKWQRDYDQRGRLIEQRFYIEETTLTENVEGTAILRWIFDEKGDLIKQSCFDAQDKPHNNIYGVAHMEYTYNAFRAVEAITFYNEDDEIAMCSLPQFNCARVEFEYDQQGNLVITNKYDEFGDLIQ